MTGIDVRVFTIETPRLKFLIPMPILVVDGPKIESFHRHWADMVFFFRIRKEADLDLLIHINLSYSTYDQQDIST